MTDAYQGSEGFTILELAVAIGIIGILAVMTLSIPSSMRTTARDQERNDDVTSLMRRLELAYSAQEIGGPGYPSTVELLSDITNNTRTATRLDKGSLTAPAVSVTSSVVAATSASTTNPISGGPTKDQYVYQPLTSSDSLCTSATSASTDATTCVRFNFYFLTETDNVVHKLKSFHQQ